MTPLDSGPGSLSRAYIELTEGCDSHCKLCDYWKIKNPRFLSLLQVRNEVIPLLKKYTPLDNLTLTGGEPTLNPALADICSELSPLARSLTIVTSTSHLADHYEQLPELVSSYLISFDSAYPRTYRKIRGVDLGESVLNWVRRIRLTSNARVALNCVIQTSNYDHIYETVQAAFDAGAQHFFMTATSSAVEAYGRLEGVPVRTTRAAVLTPAQLDIVESQLLRLIEDFTEEQLPTKHLFPQLFELLAGEKAWEGETCDVPWTSFVVSARQKVLPCFYMPFKAPLQNADDIRDLVRSVQDSMLGDPVFRAAYCDHCPCFMSRRRSVMSMHQLHLRSLERASAKVPTWGYNDPGA